jgi:spore germination cell wall hydrolase CwlJ-like protein
MQRLEEIIACVIAIFYLAGLGGYIHHQYMVLTTKHETEYVYVEVLPETKYIESNDTIIEGYTENPNYGIYEMTEDDITEEEYMDSLELLAACVEAEAGNQGLLGKRLVADVVLNRVDSQAFPNTIEEVIKQPYHFSSYWNGMIDSVSITEESFEAVRMELESRSYPSLLYFTAGGYSEYGTPWKKIGDHYFSTK